MSVLWQFAKLLFRQWVPAAIAVLGLVSTVLTYIPAFYTRFAVPRWVPLCVLLGAFFTAAFRVYKVELEREVHQTKEVQQTIAELKREIAALKVRPYDDQKRATAEQILGRCSVRHRDLLRYLLLYGEPTVQNTYGSTWLPRDEVNRNVEDLERDDIIQRNEDPLRGFPRLCVKPMWEPVFQDLLFPRNETTNPPYYG